jgi:hypothetical protein
VYPIGLGCTEAESTWVNEQLQSLRARRHARAVDGCDLQGPTTHGCIPGLGKNRGLKPHRKRAAAHERAGD